MNKGKFIRWRAGGNGSRILIDAIHAAGPYANSFTGPIAQVAAERLQAHCIVAVVSRKAADLNRPFDPRNAEAIAEYRAVVRLILEESGMLCNGRLKTQVLHLAVHGMVDTLGYDVELGTRRGEGCSKTMGVFLLRSFRQWAKKIYPVPRIVVDEYFIGSSSHTQLRQLFGRRFNTVQVEYAHWLRDRFPEPGGRLPGVHQRTLHQGDNKVKRQYVSPHTHWALYGAPNKKGATELTVAPYFMVPRDRESTLVHA